jgi:hypothetical protein
MPTDELQQADPAMGGMPAQPGPPTAGAPQQATGGVALAEPTEEEIKKYDLEIQGYASEQDIEDIDYSEF